MVAHPAEMGDGLALAAFELVVEAEEASGVGLLGLIDRRFQKPPLVDLTAEQLDDRIRPCRGIQPVRRDVKERPGFGVVVGESRLLDGQG